MPPDGAGLCLRIRDGGGASWTFRYKLHGKDRWLEIGDPRDTSLASARVLARCMTDDQLAEILIDLS